MLSNLVVYKNELNSVSFNEFNMKDMDLFFSICSQIKNKGVSKIKFSFLELKKLSNLNNLTTEEFYEMLKRMYSKLLKLNIKIENEKEILQFILFTEYHIDKENKNVTVKVHDKFSFILNNIFKDFTQFELKEFIDLKSGYSKTCYRFLKQFKGSKYVIMEIEEFKRKFDIPKRYCISDIDKRVLKPIEKELIAIFPDFKIQKLYKSNINKKKVSHIEMSY